MTPEIIPADPSLRMGPPRSVTLSSKPGAVDLLRALKRRWVQAAALGLSCATITAVGVWCFLPRPKQVISARLEVAASRPKILSSAVDPNPDYSIYQRTQIALVKSKRVFREALEDPAVAQLSIIREQPNPIDWLDQEIEAVFANGSEILRISINSDSTREAVVLINRIAEIYLSEIVNKERDTQQQRYAMLKNVLDDLQESLKQKRQHLRTLQEAAGSGKSVVLTYMQQLAMQKLSKAEMELMDVRSQIKRAQLESTESPSGREPKETDNWATLVEMKILEDPGVVDRQGAIVEFQGRLRGIERLARDKINDPAATAVRREILIAQRDLTDYVKRLRPVIEEQLRSNAASGTLAGAGGINGRIAMLEKLESQIAHDVEKFTEEAKSLNLRTLDLQAFQDEIDQSELVAQKIAAEVASLEVELKAPPRVQLLDRADVASVDVNKQRARMAVIAGSGVLCLIVLSISYLEFRARRIGSVDEVTRYLGIKLVGALPSLPASLPAKQPEISRRRDQTWYAHLAESIDATRATLLHASREQNLRVLMVVSAMSGEGKTTLASYLATSLAHSGRKTLLLDCDLRKPAVHRIFDQLPTPGLCELLRGEAKLSEITYPTCVSNLWVAPAGRFDDAAIEALAREELSIAIDHYRSEFDFVIIDTAPILLVADSLSVLRSTDAVLMSILRGVSRVPLVDAAHDRLVSLGARMLGAIVSGAPWRLGTLYY